MARRTTNRSNSVNEEPKIAKKPKMIKIKLSPKTIKNIKSKTTQIGPGGKETIIKDCH